MPAKILIQKCKKQYLADLEREVTIVKQRQYYIDDVSKDFSTSQGTIKKSELKKVGVIKSMQGKEFHIFDASFIDDYRRIKRLPQIIPLKDIGFIIAKTGLGKESVVVEGGTGSGALAIMLARFCKKVYSYDIEKEHLSIAAENIKSLGIKNIVLKNRSMYDCVDEKDVDLVCLDLPEPWKALDSASKSLMPGGFIVSYSPAIVQSADFVNALSARDDFINLKTVEVIEREWEIDQRKVRPTSKSIIHSGFISIGRKV
jgi:tRNA (adenine57-N1/adenine58-N1)-methyltransferase